ncbi:MAG: hypothetical protein AAF481_09690 [Acidobacteriota bacterium]
MTADLEERGRRGGNGVAIEGEDAATLGVVGGAEAEAVPEALPDVAHKKEVVDPVARESAGSQSGVRFNPNIALRVFNEDDAWRLLELEYLHVGRIA